MHISKNIKSKTIHKTKASGLELLLALVIEK